MSSSIGDAAMWHVKHEWLKPGITERQIEAKVHDFMLSRGCEIIYDIIVIASSGHLINQHTQAQITALDVNTFNKANEQIFDNLDIEKILFAYLAQYHEQYYFLIKNI